MSTAAQLAANQANSKFSTGPQTEAGKSASSRNSFRHGLSGAFVIRPSENAEHYDQLLDGLRDEHQPANPTEALLVERMAQHWWLAQRAISMQELCFHEKALMVLNGNEKEFALYLRYQTTNERAFHKCLDEFRKLRADKAREERTIEQARRQEEDQRRKQELHEARLKGMTVKTEAAKAKARPAASAPAASPVKLAPGPFDAVPGYQERVQQVFAQLAAQDAELEAYLNSQRAA